jgi:site-specific DNA recombinase
VSRILHEPAARGTYYYNTTRRIGEWQYEDKPEDQWSKLAVTPIISEDLWHQVSVILGELETKTARPGRAPVRLFGGLTVCQCGYRMYVPSGSRKYTCVKCKNKILSDDLEAIFHEEMKRFFVDPDRVAQTFENSQKRVDDKEALLANHRQEIQKVREDMTRTHRLYLAEQITLEAFGGYHKPLEERLRQLQDELARLEGQLDHIKVSVVSAEQVLREARGLYARWPKMPVEEKRRVVQSIVQRITIGKDEIDITLSHMPSSVESTKSQQLV